MADVDPPAVFANGQICWQQLSTCLSTCLTPVHSRIVDPCNAFWVIVAFCRASGRRFCVARVLALHNTRIKIVTAYKQTMAGERLGASLQINLLNKISRCAGSLKVTDDIIREF